MDYTFQGRHPPSELAAMVAHPNAVSEEDDWLADSGANNHITTNLENLSINQPYNGTKLSPLVIVVVFQLHILVPLLLKHQTLFYTLKMFFTALKLLQTYYPYKIFVRIIVVSLN
jgi:hypothetical protein